MTEPKPVCYVDLTPDERGKIRELYIQAQSNLCLHCNRRLDLDPPKWVTRMTINWTHFPPNFLRFPVHLQHNHKTGLTEGAVHSYCNAVLWQYYGR